MQNSTITETTADDYAHDATNIANSYSQSSSARALHATSKEYHKQASKMHQMAHDRHAEREAINGDKYHGLLMQHHKNMIAFHNDQSK